MIIHHQDGSRLAVETVVKILMGKSGRMYLCYKAPESGAKGIVEFSVKETEQISQLRLSIERVDDESLWRIF